MIHQVTEDDLESVAGSGGSLHLTFFGICCGGAVSLVCTLTTAPMASAKMYASYFALAGVSVLGTVYFGIRGLIDYRRAAAKLREIRNSSKSQ